MDFLSNYGLFLLKAITVLIVTLIILGSAAKASKSGHSEIKITHLNKKYKTLKKTLLSQMKQKPEKTPKKKKGEERPNLFVLTFNGDMKASQSEQLREEITALLSIAKKHDQVLINIESPGGSVNGYGFAAAQIQRLRDANLNTIACIDKVAASGGYLMACCAHKIIAAPFSIIGSIGVVAQLPNFHRWLKKHDIDFELLTAGEYKRTLTIFGENTEKGRAKFQEDLERIHLAFRNYVFEHRDQMDMNEVATGEHWIAKDAYELKLVDELSTSDAFIQKQLDTFNIYQFHTPTHPTWIEKIIKPAAQLFQI